MTRYRIAILAATGTARKRTIPAILASGVCDIVGIQGRDEAKLAEIARERAIPCYFTDPIRLLDSTRPDFVFIGSPPRQHLEDIKLCVERQIPLICEKPLCLSSVEADSIRTMLAKSQVPLRIAHHVRHQPGVKRIREAIQQGSYGGLRRASLQWAFWLNEMAPNASWKLNPETGGANAFFDAGIHAIDLLQYLLPPPDRVVAISNSSRFPRTVDNVSALISCGSTIAELNTCQSTRFPRNELSLDFADASIHVTRALGETAFTSMELTDASGTHVETFSSVNPYAEEIRDFVNLLENGRSCGTSIEEACVGVKILEAITESCATGNAVPI